MAKQMNSDGPESPASQSAVSSLDEHRRHVEAHQKLRREAGIGPLTPVEAWQLEMLLNDPEYRKAHGL